MSNVLEESNFVQILFLYLVFFISSLLTSNIIVIQYLCGMGVCWALLLYIEWSNELEDAHEVLQFVTIYFFKLFKMCLHSSSVMKTTQLHSEFFLCPQMKLLGVLWQLLAGYNHRNTNRNLNLLSEKVSLTSHFNVWPRLSICVRCQSSTLLFRLLFSFLNVMSSEHHFFKPNVVLAPLQCALCFRTSLKTGFPVM